VLLELPVLLRVARTMTGQPADAEDLVQDTLLRAWRALDTFDGRHPRAWLTVMRHTEINRHRRRRPELLDDPDLPGACNRAAAGPSPSSLSWTGPSTPLPKPPCLTWRPSCAKRSCWSTSTSSATPKPQRCSGYPRAPSPAGCTEPAGASGSAFKQQA